MLLGNALLPVAFRVAADFGLALQLAAVGIQFAD